MTGAAARGLEPTPPLTLVVVGRNAVATRPSRTRDGPPWGQTGNVNNEMATGSRRHERVE